jgi:hypothetical protein
VNFPGAMRFIPNMVTLIAEATRFPAEYVSLFSEAIKGVF